MCVFCRVIDRMCFAGLQKGDVSKMCVCFAGLQTACVYFARLQKVCMSEMCPCVLQGYKKSACVLQGLQKVCVPKIVCFAGLQKILVSKMYLGWFAFCRVTGNRMSSL